MKKLIFIMAFIFLPTIVLAANNRYEVKSIEVVEKSDGAIEKEQASYQDGKLKISISLNDVDDYIKYKIVVKNLDDRDYNLNIDLSSLDLDFMFFDILYSDDSSILMAKEEKEVLLTIRMINNIPYTQVVNNPNITPNNTYSVSKTVTINMTSDEEPIIDDTSTKEIETSEEKGIIKEEPKEDKKNDDNSSKEIKEEINPNTNDAYIIIYFTVLIIVLILLIILKCTKARKFMMFVLIANYMALPLKIKAIEDLKLEIESEIEVNVFDTYMIKYSDNDFSYHSYIKGMNVYEYFQTYGFSTGFGVNSLREGCDYYEFIDYDYLSCRNEGGSYEECRLLNRGKDTYANNFLYSKIISSKYGYYSYYSCCLTGDMIVEVYDEKKKKKFKKKLKDVTKDDKILVWDFDEGCSRYVNPLWIQKPEEVPFYYELLFSDGTTLEVIGDHKIYSVDKECFVNVIEGDDAPIGMKTINLSGKVISLVSRRQMIKNVLAYNIITDKHINFYANGIITSWKINNLYNIKNMRFVKKTNNNPLNKKLYSKLDKEYIMGLRLEEINKDLFVDNIENYIKNLVDKITK